jgi:hypothetical protein
MKKEHERTSRSAHTGIVTHHFAASSRADASANVYTLQPVDAHWLNVLA